MVASQQVLVFNWIPSIANIQCIKLKICFNGGHLSLFTNVHALAHTTKLFFLFTIHFHLNDRTLWCRSYQNERKDASLIASRHVHPPKCFA